MKKTFFSLQERYLQDFEAELVDFEDNLQGVMRFLKDEELETSVSALKTDENQ